VKASFSLSFEVRKLNINLVFLIPKADPPHPPKIDFEHFAVFVKIV
jgi:hypothetical protein